MKKKNLKKKRKKKNKKRKKTNEPASQIRPNRANQDKYPFSLLGYFKPGISRNELKKKSYLFKENFFDF